MSKLRSINRSNGTSEDVEVLAAKARLERQQKCSDAIQEILNAHDCQMYIALMIGDARVRLNEVVNFPGAVMIEAKPK